MAAMFEYATAKQLARLKAAGSKQQKEQQKETAAGDKQRRLR